MNGQDHDQPVIDQVYAAWLQHCDELLQTGQPIHQLGNLGLPETMESELTKQIVCLRNLRDMLADTAIEDISDSELGSEKLAATIRVQGSRCLGRFEIRAKLGEGGFGVVYLAFDPKLARPIALKIPWIETLLSPARHQRFLSEGFAAARLDHPNIVTVYETGDIDGIPYLASAYCPGVSLAAWLQQRVQHVGCAEACTFMAVVAEAVEHAHQRGVLHRDLKPANILLQLTNEKQTASLTSYVPKITDFGLAKLCDGTQQNLTRSGTVIGSRDYMAPELANGIKEIGPAVDIYSLGAILYEMLSGHPPQTQVPLGLTDPNQKRPHMLKQDLPSDLNRVILRCLETDPTKRYANAAALAQELRQLSVDHTRIVPYQSRRTRCLSYLRRQRILLLLLVAIIGLTLLVFLSNWGTGNTSRLIEGNEQPNESITRLVPNRSQMAFDPQSQLTLLKVNAEPERYAGSTVTINRAFLMGPMIIAGDEYRLQIHDKEDGWKPDRLDVTLSRTLFDRLYEHGPWPENQPVRLICKIIKKEGKWEARTLKIAFLDKNGTLTVSFDDTGMD